MTKMIGIKDETYFRYWGKAEKDGRVHSLLEHLAGLWHDLGKYYGGVSAR